MTRGEPERDRPRIKWATKVPLSLIRRAYLNDASGITDEPLIDRVGWALYARCESILMVTSAREVDCPSCDVRIRTAGERWSRESGIHCEACGWQATYGEWRDSWRHRCLAGGNAIYAFEEFVTSYPSARTPARRMVAIDRLIHAFHWSLRRDRPHGPAAANLLEGSTEEVGEFLEELSSRGSREGGADSGARRRSWAEDRNRRE